MQNGGSVPHGQHYEQSYQRSLPRNCKDERRIAQTGLATNEDGQGGFDASPWRTRLASQVVVASMPSQPRVRMIALSLLSSAGRPAWPKRMVQSLSCEPDTGTAALR